jgi:O-acetyl-ADP-ribose deacetylase (regulator of RNase III)
LIIYTSGDLLKSTTEALVNTVNCEGFMGKGIAYQFKLQYPINNKEYVEACKTGTLKIGKMHYTSEQGKIIINFPTKDKWRAKSKMEYVEKGLDALVILIKQLNIRSISLPPLGSGNGGLIWGDVKQLIERKLNKIASEVDIYIYESSKSHGTRNTNEPILNISAMILMEIKGNLRKFNITFLQSAAVIVDILSVNKFFVPNDDIPISKVISELIEKIKDFQAYHNVETTAEAKAILYNKIISENVKIRINETMPYIKKACDILNSVETDRELICLLTLVTAINQNEMLTNEEIVQKVITKAQHVGHKLSQEEALLGLDRLIHGGIVEMVLVGYSINRN